MNFSSLMIPEEVLSNIADEEDYLKETVLKLDFESVKVHEVKGVKYECESIDVLRQRMDKKEYKF